MKEAKNYGRDSYWDQKPGVDEERDPAINQSHSQDPWGANLEEDKDIIEILLVQKDINMPMIRSNRITVSSPLEIHGVSSELVYVSRKVYLILLYIQYLVYTIFILYTQYL